MNLELIRQICKNVDSNVKVSFDKKQRQIIFEDLEFLKHFGMKYSWNAFINLDDLSNVTYECVTKSITSGIFSQKINPPENVKNKLEKLMNALIDANK